MVGYFASIVKKFAQEGMPLAVFDLKNHVSSLSPEVEKERHLAEADAVILTSTSVFNNTFTGIINSTPDNCDIFMLGPSSIMSPDLLQYRNIKVISGAVFEESDHRVLQIIDNDGGTRDFLRYENKKSINILLIII